MIDTADNRRSGTGPVGSASRPVNVFTGWWLTSFGVALAALYLIYFLILFRAGTWILDKHGLPIFTDFGNAWTAATEALHGHAAAVYDPARLPKAQALLFPGTRYAYPYWPYPPTYFLILAPLALVPYQVAFIGWDLLTLIGCLAVVYLIVRRRTAIALALAAPFTAWNLLAAQSGFLTGALVGAALLALERRPLLAGMFVGCLTYKPQFGILFPLALFAGRRWRAIASAAATAMLLAALSALLFGVGTWFAWPRMMMAQTGLNLFAGAEGNWGYLQTVYGLVRSLRVAAGWAWPAQGAAALAAAVAVWRIWRSDAAYPLKAASLSAAALIATPYAFAYDMAALVIPAAFLATDQLDRALLPGDKLFWIGLFGVPLALLVTLGDNAAGPTFGGVPVGLAAAIALFAAILRRAWRWPRPCAPACASGSVPIKAVGDRR
jgi:hypothetical protein